jgi:hypothetical protein
MANMIKLENVIKWAQIVQNTKAKMIFKILQITISMHKIGVWSEMLNRMPHISKPIFW